MSSLLSQVWYKVGRPLFDRFFVREASSTPGVRTVHTTCASICKSYIWTQVICWGLPLISVLLVYFFDWMGRAHDTGGWCWVRPPDKSMLTNVRVILLRWVSPLDITPMLFCRLPRTAKVCISGKRLEGNWWPANSSRSSPQWWCARCSTFWRFWGLVISWHPSSDLAGYWKLSFIFLARYRRQKLSESIDDEMVLTGESHSLAGTWGCVCSNVIEFLAFPRQLQTRTCANSPGSDASWCWFR